METVLLILCIFGAWIFIERAIDPEKALKWNLEYHLFFRDSEPTPLYFRLTRIINGVLAAFCILLAIWVLWDTFGKL